jgi:hypothetical protein
VGDVGVVKRWVQRVNQLELTNEEAGRTIGVKGETARMLRTGQRKSAKPQTLRAMRAYLDGHGKPAMKATKSSPHTYQAGMSEGIRMGYVKAARELLDKALAGFEAAIPSGPQVPAGSASQAADDAGDD